MTHPVEYWPGTRVVKSMDNAFSEHLREKRSIFRGDPKFRSNAAPVVTDPLAQRWASANSRAVPSGSGN